MENEEIYELTDEEIFTDISEAIAIIWWLVSLLGGEVAFPMDEQFWKDNFPEQTRLVMRKENGLPVLVAEKKAWTNG